MNRTAAAANHTAPTDYVVRAAISVAPVTSAFSQPLIEAGAVKLDWTYEHGGLWLDLYGINAKHGITVEDVALIGSNVSLAAVVGDKLMDAMGEWCERQAQRDAWQRKTDAGFDGACALMMRAA